MLVEDSRAGLVPPFVPDVKGLFEPRPEPNGCDAANGLLDPGMKSTEPVVCGAGQPVIWGCISCMGGWAKAVICGCMYMSVYCGQTPYCPYIMLFFIAFCSTCHRATSS